jgi:hypothetical protein
MAIPALRTTGVGRRGGEARRARRAPRPTAQPTPLAPLGKGVGCWAGGDFEADHGFAFAGVGRKPQGALEPESRARGPTGAKRRMCARPCCV